MESNLERIKWEEPVECLPESAKDLKDGRYGRMNYRMFDKLGALAGSALNWFAYFRFVLVSGSPKSSCQLPVVESVKSGETSNFRRQPLQKCRTIRSAREADWLKKESKVKYHLNFEFGKNWSEKWIWVVWILAISTNYVALIGYLHSNCTRRNKIYKNFLWKSRTSD